MFDEDDFVIKCWISLIGALIVIAFIVVFNFFTSKFPEKNAAPVQTESVTVLYCPQCGERIEICVD